MRSQSPARAPAWLATGVGAWGLICLAGPVSADPQVPPECRIRLNATIDWVEQQANEARISAPVVAATFLRARDLCRTGEAAEAFSFCDDVIEMLSHSSLEGSEMNFDP
jgi:hypothetical protein